MVSDNVAIINAEEKYCASQCDTLNAVAAEHLYLSVNGGFLPDAVLQFHLLCRANSFPQMYAVDLSTDRAVGWCDIVARDGLPRSIGFLGVGLLPEYRGQGLGRRLIELTAESAWRSGFTELRLECRAANTRAINLYRSLGFKKYAFRRNALKLDGETFSVIYMKISYRRWQKLCAKRKQR